MQAERWRKVEEVFHAVLDEAPQSRAKRLAAACRDDPELRREVESLLDRHGSRGDLLSRGIQLPIPQHLEAGEQVCDYRIHSLIGRGGMGEVYRAHDTRLKREVAIKILPGIAPLDATRLRRFEREAQLAGSLSDPHILAIYGFGYHHGCPYLVSELLSGESLRCVLRRGKLKPDRVVELALQVANGLIAAHHAGIVHRDIKPENLFLTNRGTVKILDFGIAQRAPGWMEQHGPETNLTAPGTLLGTTAYMSPEQVRAEGLDGRSDLFSLGCVMHELAGGQRPFAGHTAADIASSILKDEPPSLDCGDKHLERLIRHCLEKDPAARCQSAVDLKFMLESRAAGKIEPRLGAKRTAVARIAASTCLATVALAVGYYLPAALHRRQPIHFERLTFGNGRIGSARFAPDGTTVVYNAAWDGEPSQIFTVNPGNPESRSLGFANSELLSVSRSGQLAVLLAPRLFPLVSVGAMAQVPFAGGTPRRIVGGSCAADWTPDGTQFLVVTHCNNLGHGAMLEHPLGRRLYITSGWISDPKFLPGTNLIAFVDHPEDSSDEGYVALIDQAGKKRILGNKWSDISGLQWNRQTREIWFTASESAVNRELYAIDLTGRQRLVYQTADSMLLHDISESGRVLFETTRSRIRTILVSPGVARARSLAVLDGSKLNDLSADGKYAVLSEGLAAFGGRDILYLVDTSGAIPPVKLGEGAFAIISPDSRWVAARAAVSHQLILYSTAEGMARRIPLGDLSLLRLGWLAASPHSPGPSLVFEGAARGQPLQLYRLSPEGDGHLFPVPLPDNPTPPYRISPDGKHYLRFGDTMRLGEMNGPGSRALDGLPVDADMYKWSRDGKSIFVVQQENVMLRVSRYDLASGRLLPWHEIVPDDPAGLLHYHNFAVAADNRKYAYSYAQRLSVLFAVDGLR